MIDLNTSTGFELVKQNRIVNHFMKNAKCFNYVLQTNLVKFCELNSCFVFLCLINYEKGLLEAHKSNLKINPKRK